MTLKAYVLNSLHPSLLTLFQLIHKVRSGQNAEEAVQDIVTRGVSEIRKNAFGDDAEDAKSLPWSREQAWVLMKRLIKQDEVRQLSC